MSSLQNYHILETPLGWLGIAWSEKGLTQLQLPSHDRTATERRLQRRTVDGVESDPPAWVADIVEGKVSLPGRPEMLTEIAADQAAMRKRYVASKRHTIQVDYWPYLHQLRDERKNRATAQLPGTPTGRTAREEIAA